jgi:hypothetical protein
MRIRTPSTTHSQIRPEPEPLAAAGELLGSAVTAGAEALLAAAGELLGSAVTAGAEALLAADG